MNSVFPASVSGICCSSKVVVVCPVFTVCLPRCQSFEIPGRYGDRIQPENSHREDVDRVSVGHQVAASYSAVILLVNQRNSIQFNSIQFNSIQFNSIQFNNFIPEQWRHSGEVYLVSLFMIL